eukprot:Rhum_TRINITY_DN14617_c0_g1::Rhum_TRINITY_DN14617_c0_g1_i1::g.105110::m.105110
MKKKCGRLNPYALAQTPTLWRLLGKRNVDVRQRIPQRGRRGRGKDANLIRVGGVGLLVFVPHGALTDPQEQLLQRCFADGVVGDAQVAAVVLNQAEHGRQRHLLLGHLVRQTLLHRLKQVGSAPRLLDELLQPSLSLQRVHLKRQLVRVTQLVLQLRQRAEALQAAVHHDGHAMVEPAQTLDLLKVVRRQDDRQLQLRDRLLQRTPQRAACQRVHAGAGLVEEDGGGSADQRSSDLQLAPVAATQGAGKLVPVCVEAQAGEEDVGAAGPVLVRDAAQAGEEVQVFLAREVVEQGVELRAEAQVLPRQPRLQHNVVSRKHRASRRRFVLGAQHRQRRRLPRTVRAEERKQLAASDTERHVADRNLLRRTTLRREHLAQALHRHVVAGAALRVLQHLCCVPLHRRVLVERRLAAARLALARHLVEVVRFAGVVPAHQPRASAEED